MSLPIPSILSEIARQLGDFVNSNASGRPQIRIGPPADAEPASKNFEPIVNLFLYRIEPSGFYPDATVHDPFHVRIHCIITAYSSPTNVANDDGTETMISAGEINLRLLGSIVQLFHETPVHDIVFRRTNPDTSVEEEIRTALQVVFKPLSSEEINQIWATQGDTAYRASLAYELALGPVTPWQTASAPAPVASAHLSVEQIAGAAAANGQGQAGGKPDLANMSDNEAALVQAAKDNPPELPPELLFAGTNPAHSRIVNGWEEDPGGGADPVFVTDAETVELTFTPYAGITGHSLSIYERVGEAWSRIDLSSLNDPGPGEQSVAVNFNVIKRPGKWMFYVESNLPVPDEPTATLRSNVAMLEVRKLSAALGVVP